MAFLVGWLLFGLLTATILAIVVMALIGILRISQDALLEQTNTPR